jgi:hypothetical protein
VVPVIKLPDGGPAAKVSAGREAKPLSVTRGVVSVMINLWSDWNECCAAIFSDDLA